MIQQTKHDRKNRESNIHKMNTFSKKDEQFLQATSKTIIQNYYENPTQPNANQIILLNSIIQQSIDQQCEINYQQILARMEVLKMKAKKNQQLVSSIQSTVKHLKHPNNLQMHAQTIEESLKFSQLYSFCCIAIQRLYKSKIQNKFTSGDINRIVKQICEGCHHSHLNIGLQTLSQLMETGFQLQVQSGIIELAQKIIDNSLRAIMKDKLQLPRFLKLLKMCAKLDPSVIKQKQDKICQLFYQCTSALQQMQQIVQICYDQQYSSQIIANPIQQSINKYYVWSYNTLFCKQLQQSNLNAIQHYLSKLHNQNQNQLTVSHQHKIYTILIHLLKASNLKINANLSFPIHTQHNFVTYLSLIAAAIEDNSLSQQQNFNINGLNNLYKTYKNVNQETTKLMKNIKQHFQYLAGQNSKSNEKNPSTIWNVIQNQPQIPISKQKQKNITQNNNRNQNKIEQENQIINNNNQRMVQQNVENVKESHKQIISETISQKQQNTQKQQQQSTLKKEKISIQIVNKNNQKQQNIQDQQIKCNNIQMQQENKQKIINQIAKDKTQQIKNQKREADKMLEQKKQKQHHEINLPKVQYLQNSFTLFLQMLQTGVDSEEDFQYLQKLFKNANLYFKINPSSISRVNKFKLRIIILKIQQKKHGFLHFQQLTEVLYVALGYQKWQEIKQNDIKSQNFRKVVVQQLIKLTKDNNQTDQTHKIKNVIQAVQIVTMIQNLKITEQTKQKIQKQNTKNQKVENTQMIVEEHHKFLPNIILKYKIIQMVQKWQKRVKKSKQRFYILREWAQTEDAYLKKLLVLRDEVRQPLLVNKMINQVDSMMIFPNLDAMIELAKQMATKVKQLIQGWSPIITQVAPSLKIVTNYLKIYKDYSLNYNKSYGIMKDLSQKSKYSTIVKVVNLQNYLFSPVQRFQKYHLFVSSYLKNLRKEHKDYEPLQKALSLLLKVTDEINQFIENQSRSSQMIQLQNTFGNVITTARQLKTEFIATCFDFKCKVHVLNDLLLVTRFISDTKQQLYMRIELNSTSFVSKQPDCKSFQNRLYICGSQNSIHLLFIDKEQLQSVYRLLYDLIEALYQNQFMRQQLISQSKFRKIQAASRVNTHSQQKKWKQQIYYKLNFKVEVAGVLKRVFNQVLNRTYFIVKIQIPKPEDIKQYAFCELQELNSLQKYLKQLYPDLKIPTLEIKNRGATFLDLNKVSEHECIAIQIFLNFILRNTKISSKPELILHKLGLHQTLWQYINADKSSPQCLCDLCSHAQIFTGINYYYEQRQLIRSRKYKFCILNSFRTQNTIRSFVDKIMFKDLNIESKLVWVCSQMQRIDYRLKQNKIFGSPITFRVQVKLLSQQLNVQVKQATKYSTCRDVIEEVCRKIGIETTLDLALVLMQENNVIILDDDEYIYDTYMFLMYMQEKQQRLSLDTQNTEKSWLFSRLSLGGAPNPPKKKPKISLCLRKIIIFSETMQEKACQANPQRYKLILGQMLRKYEQNTFILNYEDIRMLCAFLYCIENYNSLMIQKNISLRLQILQKYLPQSKWNLLTKQFQDKVLHIIENQLSLSDKASLLYLCVLKQFGQKFTWHCQYFPLQNTEPSVRLGNINNICIGVSYRKITITKQNTTTVLLEYPINQFKYHIYAQSLYMKSQESEDKLYRFIGPNLNILDKLLQTYKLIYDFEH